MSTAPRATGWGRLPEVVVTTDGPFAVGSIVWRDARGQLMCTVVAKATYELVPGESAPSDVPLPIQDEDVHWDDDPSRSVHVPSDLAPTKPSAEVVVVGSAFAPNDRAVRSVVARVLVGSVDKAVECFPPRRFRLDGTVDDYSPLVRFSLRYEHAAGGPGSDNPAGIDVNRGDVRGRRPIPPLLPPAFTLGAPGEHIPTAGLGPIASRWPSRNGGLGPHERAWIERPAASPMPETLAPRYFQSAPPDQWLDRHLVPNERVVLENLHARHPRLVTSLGGIEPRAFVASTGQPLRLVGDMLFIDTDRKLCTLTFRGQMPLAEGNGRVRVVVAGVPMGSELSPDSVRALLDQAGSDGDDDDTSDAIHLDPEDAVIATTQMPMWSAGAGARPALPFARAVPPPRPSTPSLSDGALPFRGTAPEPARTPVTETAPAPIVAPPSMPAPSLGMVLQPAATPFTPPTEPPPPVMAPPPPPVRADPLPPPPVRPEPVLQPPVRIDPPPPIRPEPVVAPPPPVTAPPLISLSSSPSNDPPLSFSAPRASDPVKPASFEGGFGSKPSSSGSSFDSSFGSKPSSSGSSFDSSFGSKPSSSGSSFDSSFGSKPSSSGSSFDSSFGGNGKPAASGGAGFDGAFGAKPAPVKAPAKQGAFDAAFGGVKAASDAAADKERVKDAAPGGAAPKAEVVLKRQQVVDLIHFESRVAPRLRTLKRFQYVWAQAARPRAVQGIDEPRAEPPPSDKERADVLRVLSFGRVDGAHVVHRVLADSLEEAVDLDAPLVLVAGELRCLFDEIETLRASVAIAQPIAGTDKKLLAAISVAQEALNAQIPPRPDATLGFAKQIDNATVGLSLPPRYLAGEVERVLLEGRKYKRRPVLGAIRVRADVIVDGETMAVYLPEAVVPSMPLLPSIPVIMLCEVRPREDMTEVQDEALLAVALGRVLKARGDEKA